MPGGGGGSRDENSLRLAVFGALTGMIKRCGGRMGGQSATGTDFMVRGAMQLLKPLGESRQVSFSGVI